MKYAHINENGQILGWYDKEIHTSIPTPNIEVSDEQWKNAIDNGHNKVNEDGSTELFDFRTEEEKAQQLLAEQIAEALKYLANTDYIVTKIAEAQALGEDTAILLSKYAVELQQRKEAREFIGANS